MGLPTSVCACVCVCVCVGVCVRVCGGGCTCVCVWEGSAWGFSPVFTPSLCEGKVCVCVRVDGERELLSVCSPLLTWPPRPPFKMLNIPQRIPSSNGFLFDQSVRSPLSSHSLSPSRSLSLSLFLLLSLPTPTIKAELYRG